MDSRDDIQVSFGVWDECSGENIPAGHNGIFRQEAISKITLQCKPKRPVSWGAVLWETLLFFVTLPLGGLLLGVDTRRKRAKLTNSGISIGTDDSIVKVDRDSLSVSVKLVSERKVLTIISERESDFAHIVNALSEVCQ